jgi:glycosyltransferase involved in cell wall biosynthesis
MLGNIGGAARIAWDLAAKYGELGHDSLLAVGYPRSNEIGNKVLEINNDRHRSTWARVLYSLPRYLRRHEIRGSLVLHHAIMLVAEPMRFLRWQRGCDDFDFPGSRRLLDTLPNMPDVLNCHNLHSGYFDLRILPELSRRLPVVLTLHDMWLITGHCAYAMACTRWQNGCGECPDLKRYPSIVRDATARNFKTKKEIFEKSCLYVVTPSRWLMNSIESTGSILRPTLSRVINNGIDLSEYRPADKISVRADLAVNASDFVILFVGQDAQNNPYKDYQTIKAAIEIIRKRCVKKIVFINLGSQEEYTDILGNCEMRFYKRRGNPSEIAKFYIAADVFVHAAKADTFPSTVLESMACGTPVIATGIGGISEQINDGVTGFVVPPHDPGSMARRVLGLMLDNNKRKALADNAALEAGRRYSQDQQAANYIDFYQEAIEDHKSKFRSA